MTWASPSSDGPNSRRAAGPSGSRKTWAGRSAGFSSIQFTTGASSRQKPMGSISTRRLARAGQAAATSQATMAPNEWPISAAAGISSRSSNSS